MTVAANYAGNDGGARPSPSAPASRRTNGTSPTTRPASTAARRSRASSARSTSLVNNAGITRDGTMKRMNFEDWNEVIDINLGGCFNMAKATFPGMRERGWGRIVNIGSINGQAGQYGQVNYAAAKSGIHGFTKALAQEGAQVRRDRQRDRAGLYRHRHGRRGAAPTCWKRSSPRSRSAGSARPRRSRAASRSCASEDAGFVTGSTHVDQRRAAYVLSPIGAGSRGPGQALGEIAGHETSISLEPLFWDALLRAAAEEGVAAQRAGRADRSKLAANPPARVGCERRSARPQNLAPAQIRSPGWWIACLSRRGSVTRASRASIRRRAPAPADLGQHRRRRHRRGARRVRVMRRNWSIRGRCASRPMLSTARPDRSPPLPRRGNRAAAARISRRGRRCSSRSHGSRGCNRDSRAPAPSRGRAPRRDGR